MSSIPALSHTFVEIDPEIISTVILLPSADYRAQNVSGYRCEADCRPKGREFDPGPVPYFMEIDHEIISTVILLPSAESFMKCCRRKCVHKLMVIRLFKLSQEKGVVIGELTVPPWP